MNKLLLTTKTYVRPDGSIKINPELVRTVKTVINNTYPEEFRWMIIISNFDWDRDAYKLPISLDYVNSGRVILATTKYPMSCSQARGFVYEYLHYHPSIDFDYTFDIDDDDYLINEHKLIYLIRSPHMGSDLVGFGMEVDECHFDEWKTWDFENIKFFEGSRRYVTTDTQTMFLFFHSPKVCRIIYEDNWVVQLPKDNPHEKCEDTKMAVRLSMFNYYQPDGLKLKISAIRCNFLHYCIHPDQMSHGTLDSDRKELQDNLKKYGYNYVNTGDYLGLYDTIFKRTEFNNLNYEIMYIH